MSLNNQLNFVAKYYLQFKGLYIIYYSYFCCLNQIFECSVCYLSHLSKLHPFISDPLILTNSGLWEWTDLLFMTACFSSNDFAVLDVICPVLFSASNFLCCPKVLVIYWQYSTQLNLTATV